MLSVQVLRAAAALLVVVHHAGYDADAIAARYGHPPLGLDGLFDWTFGIHLFFVVSGFIMAQTARAFGTRGAPARFLGRRILRIAPLYWVMTTLVLIGAAVAPGLLNVPVEGRALLVGSYLFLPVTRVDGEIRPILSQGWTLDYEMFFYLVFAAGMLFPRRAGLAAIAAALVSLVVVGKLQPPSWPPAIVWTDSLLLEFLLGIGIGLAVEAGLSIPTWAGLGLALLGALAALSSGRLGGGLDPWLRQGVPAALILLGCVATPPWPRRPIVLTSAMLGDASFSLYLCHPFVIRLLRVGWTTALGDRLPAWVYVPAACASAVLAGLLLFRLVERPMGLALSRLFPRFGHRAPESGAAHPADTGG